MTEHVDYKPICMSCDGNKFEVETIETVGYSRTVDVLLCAKCKTVHGVVPADTSELESTVGDLTRTIDDLSMTIRHLMKAM